MDGVIYCCSTNTLLVDKAPFEIRVCSGDSFATPWIQVVLSEGGPLFADIPDEDLPEDLSYVKTPKGDLAIALLRNGANGLEYSTNGIDWESAINGIPDVPKTPENLSYKRVRGDWIPAEQGEAIEDLKTAPTMADFNNLLAQLRVAGIIKQE